MVAVVVVMRRIQEGRRVTKAECGTVETLTALHALRRGAVRWCIWLSAGVVARSCHGSSCTTHPHAVESQMFLFSFWGVGMSWGWELGRCLSKKGHMIIGKLE